MKFGKAVAGFLLLASTITACGLKPGTVEVKMNEKEATTRAEEIAHQAMSGMMPKPDPERSVMRSKECVSEFGSSRLAEVDLSYTLKGVPGTEAKNLVRQARDAWVKQGYTFESKSADGDWSDPFPTVTMVTPDGFDLSAVTGMLDKEKGEGIATISVTSPCFAREPSPTAHASAAALSPAQGDGAAERRVLGHSSRIYDALRARHAPEQEGEGLRTVQDQDGTWLHHAWSTPPLTDDERERAIRRARDHFHAAGWKVRDLPTTAGTPALAALHPDEDTVAQVTPAATGGIAVGVTGPAIAGPHAEA
ncbi:hypothetical protein GCM10010218_37770 [Streptomyces mashuensis]|uniref:Lipoprotein n=1 Tax=Streptomyces mashuensis TaxID=33904 RepID=A0A919B462_9ACTN|nr:hypothetical protein [Streptomyces mashuensis]GHF52763.1 hypothetical protein GCM10010218_37770 [Streptomyces mashuensis]